MSVPIRRVFQTAHTGNLTNMSTDRWADYVRGVTAGMTQVQIARKTGVAQTAISRWLNGTTEAPRAEFVVSFARALGLNPVEALVAAGFVSAEEAGAVIDARTPLRSYSTDELFEELRKRTVHGPG